MFELVKQNEIIFNFNFSEGSDAKAVLVEFHFPEYDLSVMSKSVFFKNPFKADTTTLMLSYRSGRKDNVNRCTIVDCLIDNKKSVQEHISTCLVGLRALADDSVPETVVDDVAQIVMKRIIQMEREVNCSSEALVFIANL